MSPRQVEIFRAIMLSGSLSGAARMLRLSVPAVSRALGRLEDQLGYLLFERQQGRILPTPEARELFEAADAAIRSFSRVTDLAQGLGRAGAERLVLAANPSFAPAILPAALMRFRRSHPGTLVECATTAHASLVESLALRRAELGLSQFASGHPMLEDRSLGRFRLQLAVPRASGLGQGGGAVPLEALRGLPLIGYAEDTAMGPAVARFLESGGLPATPSVVVRYSMIATTFVEAGLGVAIIDPFVTAGAVPAGVRVCPLAGAPEIEAWLIRRRTDPMGQPARSFAGLIARELQRLGEHSA